jgi:dTDP-4-dehydrorhamnose 3,5-epimerase
MVNLFSVLKAGLNMNVIETSLEGCVVIEPKTYQDQRGFFLETYHQLKYSNIANIQDNFVQDNYSRSAKDVLRGLHFQKTKPQGKLVRVVKGSVFDVAVDLRKNSATYGKHESIVLSEENKKQFYIPPGFAHGFLVLTEFADFEYKCTEFYDPSDEGSLLWNDDDIGIDWPCKEPVLSEKDTHANKLNEI